MIKLILVKPNQLYKDQYMDLINECKEDIKKCGMDYYIPLADKDSISEDIQRLDNNEIGLDLPEGWVSSSTFWLMDENYERILGAITIRHSLVGYLLFRGGHISYYVRLTERCKGYATEMLGLALEKCKALHLDKVMVTCAKNNTGSAKTIRNNGGILHSEDIEGSEEFQRYWIGN